MSTILRHKYVTTRTPHICFGCGRNILSPARMASMAYADGGTVMSYYLCETCDTIGVMNMGLANCAMKRWKLRRRT